MSEIQLSFRENDIADTDRRQRDGMRGAAQIEGCER